MTLATPFCLEVTASLSDFSSIALQKRYMTLDVAEPFNAYSGVEIIIDDETSVFAGSTNGRVLTINNPWGTQQMAENILEKLRGFTYQPYTATGALLDPAAELGDGVSLNGYYSGIFKMSKNYSSLMATEISAPQDEEIDHEYPFESKANRDIKRKFMAVESEFAIQSSEISAKVSQTGGDTSSFGWNLLSDHFSLFSGNTEVFRVDSSGATVSGVIRATSGQIGNFNIGTNAIWNNISSLYNPGGLSSGVYLGTDGIRLGNGFIATNSGNVTMNNLTANNATLNGTLTVGGAYISADTLRQGAQTAYSNSGYWSGGAGYGYGYGNATAYGTATYPSYFTCGSLWVKSSATMSSVGISGSLQYKSRTASWQTLNIGGSYYTVLVGY